LKLLYGVIKKLHHPQQKQHCIYPPKSILGNKFRLGRQEDAHEFLSYLLDKMQNSELNIAGINPEQSGWRNKLPIPRLDETTFIHRIFGGYYRSQLKCSKCGYLSNTYDPFLDVSLEISHAKNLISALEIFSKQEVLSKYNEWKCGGCSKKVCASKELSIFRPPLCLIIQLKRFKFGRYGGFVKISKSINFPLELSLNLSDDRICQYFLTGVIVHIGSSVNSGHYTAFILKPSSSNKFQWYHMDDSYVTKVSEATVLQQSDAYILFYSRKEVKSEFPLPPTSSTELHQENQNKKKSTQFPTSNTEPQAIKSSIKEDKEKSPKHKSVSSEPVHHRPLNDSMELKKNENPKNNFDKDSIMKNNTTNKKNVLLKSSSSKSTSIEVNMNNLKRKQSKPWTSTLPNTFANNLLGNNVKINQWNEENETNNERDVIAKELRKKELLRQRKIQLNTWDAHLDQAKMKKIKNKQDVELVNIPTAENPFHRIQSSLQVMKKGKRKGFGMYSSQKRK